MKMKKVTKVINNGVLYAFAFGNGNYTAIFQKYDGDEPSGCVQMDDLTFAQVSKYWRLWQK